jgi:signal transduction histidine kinase
MMMIETDRWQIFTRLNAALADSDLWEDPAEEIFEWICQLTGAGGMILSLQQEDRSIVRTWGTEAPGWQLEISLNRVGAHSCARLSGLGEAVTGDAHENFKAIADAIDASLASKQVLREERSQRRLAESLVEISRVLNSTLDLEEVLALILDRLADLVPYDSANVMLLEEGRLYLHAVRGYQDFSGPVDMSSIAFVPAHTALMNETLEGDRPIILSDTKDLPNWVWVPGGTHVRSWMGVPLRVKDQAIGLFSIDKATPNFFTARQAELASMLAAHAALALDNARMFAQLRETQAQLVGLSGQVIAAQEQERQKIAVELHDQAGQALLGLRAELQILKHSIASPSEEALAQIQYLEGIVLEISHDLRQLAHDLRPQLLTELGLVTALEQYIEEFSRRMRIPVTFEFQHERQFERLPENIELICYRIVQEALTNLTKHAQASKARIRLEILPERLVLSVTDDGVGFSPHPKRDLEGFGLIGIRERVTAVGGQLQIFSQPGRGTQVQVEIPLEPKAADE